MTNNELINKLYKGDKNDILEALYYKKNWINDIYYFKVNNQNFDEVIKSIKSGSILFSKIHFDNNLYSPSQINNINLLLNNMSIINLLNTYPYSKDILFYLELDFKKMEMSTYQELYPNFYKTDDHENLEINENEKYLEFNENLIKTLIIKNNNDNIILIENNLIKDNMYFCPIISKIILINIDNEERLNLLKKVCFEKSIEVVNYEDI